MTMLANVLDFPGIFSFCSSDILDAGELFTETIFGSDGKTVVSRLYFVNGIQVSEIDYAENGNPSTTTTFREDGTAASLTEHAEDGMPRSITMFHEDGFTPSLLIYLDDDGKTPIGSSTFDADGNVVFKIMFAAGNGADSRDFVLQAA